jgi:hypothetical protein
MEGPEEAEYKRKDADNLHTLYRMHPKTYEKTEKLAV